MSAFEDTVPALIDGCFRVTFFFSFFGLIVSVLGRNRTLPPWSALPAGPRSPPPTPNDTCGTELTVSVSTVILLSGGSIDDFVFAKFIPVSDRLGKMADDDRDGASGLSLGPLSTGLTIGCLFPPLSLPLSPPSTFDGVAVPLVSVEKEVFDNGAECGGTTSSLTVGREVLELFMSDVKFFMLESFPEADLGSSTWSELLWLSSGVETASLFMEVFGWTGSESDFRDKLRADDDGGGDIILGDRGHCCGGSVGRPLELASALEDSTTPSMLGGCCGVLFAADNALCTAAADGTDGWEDNVELIARLGDKS